MKLRVFKTLFLAGVAAATLQTTAAHALLAGVKTTGMAATSVSYPVDALAGAYNPAGITNLCSRWDMGISWVQTYQRMKIRDLPNYQEAGPPWNAPPFIINPSSLNGSRNGAKTADAYVPEGGFVKHIDAPWCGSDFDFAAGFIMYNRNDLKTTYGRPFELFGNTPLGLEFIHQTASLLFAARWCKMHSIGIAINYNIQRLKVDGLQTFANSEFSVSPQNATNRGYNYSNGVGVILGYQFNWKCLKIGLGWQPKTKMRKFDKYSGFVADHGNFDLPERFVAGISYKFCGKLAVAFDFEHINWRQIPQLKNPTFPNLFLSEFDPDYLLGAKNGAGFGFKNQDFYRFGVEYEINPCFTVRAGFRHADTPIVPRFTAVNILTLDLMENVLTFGGTWRINECNEVSIFYGLGFLKKLKGKDSIPPVIPTISPITGERTLYPINADTTTSDPSEDIYTQGPGEIDIKQKRCALGISWGKYF